MTLRLSGRASFLELHEISETPVLNDDGVRAVSDGPTLLWHALEQGATRLELVERLASEYRCDHAQAAAGTDLFLRQLRSRGLLVET